MFIWPRVYAWLRSANNKRHISWPKMYLLGCISLVIGENFLKHHNRHSTRKPVNGNIYFFFCDQWIMKDTLLLEKCIFWSVPRPPLEGFSWNSTALTRGPYTIMGIILVAIGQLWQALHLQNNVPFRFYLPCHSSDFSESPHQSVGSLPLQTTWVLLL